MSPARRAALAGGLLYFSTHLTSVAAVAVYGDAAGDLAAPDAASRLTAGAAFEVLLALGVLGTGVILLPLLAPAAPILAQTFSALRILEAAVIATGTLPMLALVSLGPSVAAAGAGVLPALHDAAFLVGQGLIISVNTLVIAALLVRTGVVPRWIGLLGLVGGVLVLVGNIGQMLGWFDRTSGWAAVAAVPVFAFEISFATYLVVRGLRPPRSATVG